MIIESIFVRKITLGDFWNIERGSGAGPTTGGGQTYIDIPLGNITFEDLFKFLNIEITEHNLTNPPEKNILIKTIGNITQSSNINFAYRGGNNRYKISNQNRHKANSQRPHCWSSDNGFPSIPETTTSSNEIDSALYENLKIIIIKTSSNEYFGGFIDSNVLPVTWPNQSQKLQQLISTTSSNLFTFDIVDNDILNVLNSWNNKSNILLYGPPGTGKTYIMNKIWELLLNFENVECLSLNTNDVISPFESKLQLPFEGPIKSKWVTFHQNYNYEDFILGLIPDPDSATLKLKARAGSLLDCAIGIDEDMIVEYELEQHKSAVIFIDEINRGNVSRIFGEFITFMDNEYRKGGGSLPLPIPLNNLSIDSDQKTEDILLPNGKHVKIQLPWYMPKNIYILASMNSVDKAVAPLDSALERRFNKINVMPNIIHLIEVLQTDSINDLISKFQISDDSPDASEVAVLLLYKINYIFATTFGKDFELGQSNFYSLKNYIDEDSKFFEIAKIWEQFIFPQIQDKFISRPDEILSILRLNNETEDIPEDFAYKFKIKPINLDIDDINTFNQLELISLVELWKRDINSVKNSLKYIAGF